MFKSFNKIAIGTLLIALAGATAANAYTYEEVFAACEGAYSHSMQVAACVNNVCGAYGCEQQ